MDRRSRIFLMELTIPIKTIRLSTDTSQTSPVVVEVSIASTVGNTVSVRVTSILGQCNACLLQNYTNSGTEYDGNTFAQGEAFYVGAGDEELSLLSVYLVSCVQSQGSILGNPLLNWLLYSAIFEFKYLNTAVCDSSFAIILREVASLFVERQLNCTRNSVQHVVTKKRYFKVLIVKIAVWLLNNIQLRKQTYNKKRRTAVDKVVFVMCSPSRINEFFGHYYFQTHSLRSMLV